MSIVGKNTVSLRKKDVKEQKSSAVGFKKLVFAHKATMGDSSISLGSLVAPSAEMPTHTNPTTNDLLSANLLFFKSNLTLISSLRGVLMLDLSYTVSSSSTILFKDFTAEDGEIFVGIIDSAPKTGLNLVDARPITATGILAEGTTDFNVGQSFRVNQYPTSQSGDVIVFRNGFQQFRNVGNSPTGEGNYYEVQAGNGLGQLIRFNDAPVGQDDNILVISNGLIAERPDGSMMAVIESLAGQIDKIVPVISDVSGQPESYFQGAPNDQDLKTFGDQVLDHENRIDILEAKQLPLAVATTSSQTLLAAGTTIIATNELVDTSNSYNPLTGIFTVPSNGHYVAELEFLQTSLTTSTVGFEIIVRKNSTDFGIWDSRKMTTNANFRKAATGRATIPNCITGDSLSIIVFDADNTHTINDVRISFKKLP